MEFEEPPVTLTPREKERVRQFLRRPRGFSRVYFRCGSCGESFPNATECPDDECEPCEDSWIGFVECDEEGVVTISSDLPATYCDLYCNALRAYCNDPYFESVLHVHAKRVSESQRHHGKVTLNDFAIECAHDAEVFAGLHGGCWGGTASFERTLRGTFTPEEGTCELALTRNELYEFDGEYCGYMCDFCEEDSDCHYVGFADHKALSGLPLIGTTGVDDRDAEYNRARVFYNLRWSIDCHTLCHREERELVATLLTCASRVEKKSGVRLPLELWIDILGRLRWGKRSYTYEFVPACDYGGASSRWVKILRND